MSMIVECFLYPVPGPMPPDFQCSDEMWDKLIVTGVSYGWLPAGTKPDPKLTTEHPFETCDRGYSCEDILAAKLVEGADAWEWADGLHAYLDRTFHVWRGRDRALQETMKNLPDSLRDEDEQTLGKFRQYWSIPFIENAEAFFRKGAFTFHWDD